MYTTRSAGEKHRSQIGRSRRCAITGQMACTGLVSQGGRRVRDRFWAEVRVSSILDVPRRGLLAWLTPGDYSSRMAPAASTPSDPKRFDPPLSAIKARQMGELARGDDRWDVVLESARDPDLQALRGRIHFVAGRQHRLSGWIFLEWAEKDIEVRFGEFSPQELWNLLDSLV